MKGWTSALFGWLWVLFKMNFTKSFQNLEGCSGHYTVCLQGPKNLIMCEGPVGTVHIHKIKFMLSIMAQKVTESVQHTSTRIVRFVTQRFSMTLFSVPSVSTHHVTCISISVHFSALFTCHDRVQHIPKISYLRPEKTLLYKRPQNQNPCSWAWTCYFEKQISQDNVLYSNIHYVPSPKLDTNMQFLKHFKDKNLPIKYQLIVIMDLTIYRRSSSL